MNRGGRTPNHRDGDGGRYSSTPRGRGRGRERERGRGRSSPRPAGSSSSAYRYRPVTTGADGSSGNTDGGSHFVWRAVSTGSISKQVDCISTSNSSQEHNYHFPGTKDISSDVGKLNLVENSPEAVTPSSEQLDCMSVSFSKQVDCISTSNSSQEHNYHFPGTEDISSDVGKLKLAENSPEAVTPSSEQLDCMDVSLSALEKGFSSLAAQPDLGDKDLNRTERERKVDAEVETGISLHCDSSPTLDNAHMLNEPPLFVGSGTKSTPSRKGSLCEQISHMNTANSERSEISDSMAVESSFDICPVRAGNLVKLKDPLHVQNRLKRNETKRSLEGKKIIELSSGMLLLRNYISLNDQIDIVKKCRNLGLSSGGFYEPGYRDGGKLHLKMMCLGKNWDPETSKYGEQRPRDGAKPPSIPVEFCQLVKGAIQASHSFLREQCEGPNVEHVLPSVSPNICIVNFYTQSGRLGLHQDKDESPGSLNRGLPVVSFSIGDSAEFLYNDQRDIESAAKVTLESGDVLIFGGKSRHIFHGVASITQGTAPKTLLDKTNLLLGRLNLTFREF